MFTPQLSFVDVSRDLWLRQIVPLFGMAHYMERHKDDADSGADCRDFIVRDGRKEIVKVTAPSSSASTMVRVADHEEC